MKSLQQCRWRTVESDRIACRSERYVGAPNVVSADFCRGCHCADHDAKIEPNHALPCVHLDGASSASRGTFHCALHGTCIVRPDASRGEGKRSCIGCGDYLPGELFGRSSREMKTLADRHLAKVPAYPKNRFRGRGIVMAAGGSRYLASLYVAVRAIRHVGCALPIEIWYLGDRGEMPLRSKRLFAKLGVSFVDADRIRKRFPARRLNGWELKAFAALHSRFREILFLDADCYPCRNPAFLFDLPEYRERGAIFWPDMASVDDRLKWPAFLEPNPDRMGSVESGQFVIDKETCWQPLNLAWHYNDRSDYYYRYCYGDKHTFEVAWARCNVPFVMWNSLANWVDVAYLHGGRDGEPLFVHRCADKFRLDPQTYVTHQHGSLPRFYRHLPLERECWQWLGEMSRAMGRRDQWIEHRVQESSVPESLTVYRSNKLKLLRLGSTHDGGYVVPDLDLPGVDGLISIGIGDNLDFELDFQRRTRGWVECFDPTIDTPPELPKRARFHRAGLGSDSIESLLKRTGKRGDATRIWLKVDAEAAEWHAFETAPMAVLRQFEVLIVEFHGLTDRTGWSSFCRPKVLDRLLRSFRLVHVHGNNFAPVSYQTGLPDCLEATYLRRDVLPGRWRGNRATLPSSLDAPCNPHAPEIDLNFRPFRAASP